MARKTLPMKRRCCAVLGAIAVAASSLLLAQGSTARASDATPTVLLRGGETPAFAWCPKGSTERGRCEAAVRAAPAARTSVSLLPSLGKDVDRVVLFLPGYRTSFLQGLRQAREVATVLGPRFFVVYVDWGSHGTLYDYQGDARAARRNTGAFAAFVTELHRMTGGRRVDVYAYSMGARVAAGAMAIVRSPGNRESIIDQAVLAAPDVTLNDYRLAITRQPVPFRHVTIYASRSDRALLLSSIVHFHHRLGQLVSGRLSLQRTDVVDASAADRATVGHGYPVHDPRVICDVAAVLLNRPIPHDAWVRTPGGVWTLAVDRIHPPSRNRPCTESK